MSEFHCVFQATEIEKLKRQVGELTKSSEQMRIERADAINRLNRSLEESQRQCQQLIEAGIVPVLIPSSYFKYWISSMLLCT